MRKLLISMAALSTLAAAAPAAAQYRGEQFGHRFDRLAERIDRAYDRGQLRPAQARHLQNEVAGAARLERRYARNGLSRSEREQLRRHVSVIGDRLNRWANDNRYAYNDRRYR